MELTTSISPNGSTNGIHAPSSRDELRALAESKTIKHNGICAVICDRDGEAIDGSAVVTEEPKVDLRFLVNANKTDPGNAECLAHLYGNKLRYCNQRKKWLIWNGSIWTTDDNGSATRLMINTCRERYRAAETIDDLEARKRFAAFAISSENSKNVDNALKAAKAMEPFSTVINQFDSDNMVAVAGDITINLTTGKTGPCRQEDYISLKLGTSYDKNAQCPLWLKTLEGIFLGDRSIIDFVQRAVGYCLTGQINEQKVFLCIGDGANGKSVLLSTVSALLGQYAAAASFDTFDADRRSTVGNDLAVLKGRRLVTVIESDEDRRLSEARVKAVTGGEDISCRFLYGEPFNYRPTWKLWIATNHKPTIRGTDNGIWRRIMLIPFEATFDEAVADKQLETKLKAELPGILNWALDGLRQWREVGLKVPPKIAAAVAEYRGESDIVGQWLEAKTVSLDDRQHTQSSELYESFKAWYTSSIGNRPMSVVTWSREMERRGYRKQKFQGNMHFYGIGILTTSPLSY